MGSTDKFCLRWNDFETNISAAFKELRQDKDFFDVTLTVDDDPNHVLQAHKVILSACSPFFRNVLLRQNAAMGVAGFSHPHPLVYLRGVSYEDLKHIIDFMYYGEVNVAQDDLQAFLQVAEDLKVKGLTQADSNSSSAPSSSSLGNSSGPSREPSGVKREPPGENGGIAKKRSRPNPAVPVPGPSHQVPVHSIDDDVQDVGDTNVKTEHLAASDFEGTDFEAVEGEGGEGDYDYAQYGDESGDMTYAEGEDGQMLPGTSGGDESKECQAEEMMTRIPGIRKHMCKICGQSAKLKHHLKRHILSKHTSTRFPCHFCQNKSWAQEHDRHKHYRRHHGLEISMKQIRDLIEEANQRKRKPWGQSTYADVTRDKAGFARNVNSDKTRDFWF
ncbi:zinc finger and BTB domain-containing protein 14-like isoform X2 [Tigriopus californicus]|uniref:zinc finger and BTB domain-containing protein 14-like isoform X2 n=1 Tax=Tigriopus californicus TaxID=6832 RepID=UPI0027DA16CB|nr:zinc finger and BTB domain-containing protein 14-like isoform X2 [Tigriopus californicus]